MTTFSDMMALLCVNTHCEDRVCIPYCNPGYIVPEEYDDTEFICEHTSYRWAPSHSVPGCVVCSIPLLENYVSNDEQFNASSFIDGFPPYHSRLHSNGAWSAADNTDDQWLSVDLGETMHITAMVSQGRSNADEWVTAYTLEYSPDGENYESFKTSQDDILIFQGNTDRSTEVKNDISSPVVARYVRIHPLSFSGHISMRVEILGCKYEPNYCVGVDCQNGGTCVSYPLQHVFECLCDHGYTGEYCERDFCEVPPAPNNGSSSCDQNNACSISCNQGFQSSVSLADSYQCDANTNTWTPPLPTVECIGVTPPTVGASQSAGSVTSTYIVGEADGFCFTWGQSHYRTYDGFMYDFHGSCSYLLTGDCTDHSFKIHVHNDRACARQSMCQRTITIFAGEIEFELKQTDDIFVASRNKETCTLPTTLDNLHIKVISQYLYISSPFFGFNLLWNGGEHLAVQAMNKLVDKTCGLCGVYNGDYTDDLSDQNGEVVDLVSAFAEGYKRNDEEDNCPDENQDSYCHLYPSNSEYATSVCDTLKGDDFAECHDVDYTPFYLACLEDVCYCNSTEDHCECQSFSAYAKECVRSGVTGLQWRTPDRCPIQCPGEQVHMEGGDTCPQTCKGTVYQCIDGISLDGCQCPSGMLQHGNVCHNPDNCPCQSGGREYSIGSVIPAADECNTCTCDAGKWSCTSNLCGATCWTGSNAHYRTFDGRHYDFMGECTYVFMSSCNGTLADYSINIENSHCLKDFDGGPLTCTKSVTITIGGTFVKLKTGHEIIVDGDDVDELDLPFEAPSIYIEQVSDQFQKVTLDNGLNVFWNGDSRLYVTAPNSFFNNTCGLCGTFDGNQQNDFWTLERDVEKLPTAFGNKWSLKGSCTADTPMSLTHPCDVYAQRRAQADDFCKQLKEEPFTDCSSHVDVNNYYTNCMFDLCSGNADMQQVFCDVAAMYAMECSNRGLVVVWRDSIDSCPVSCSGEKGYQECGSSCKTSCAALAGNRPCEENCVPGCSCPYGMVEDYGGSCISEEDCPCLFHGKFYIAGQVVEQGCKPCTCDRGHWYCEDIECAPTECGDNMEFVSCKTECPQTCSNMHSPPSCATAHCQSGCQCMENYVWNGDECILPKDCPCHHGGKSYRSKETIKVECNQCVCDGSHWVCEDKMCPGICTGWGESHHKTFDGKLFDYFGECTYIMSRSTLNNPHIQYTITTENVICGYASKVTCAKSITFSVGTGSQRETIKLERNTPVEVPVGSVFKVWRAGLYIFVKSAGGVTLQWDRGTRVYIKLETQHRGLVEGICGNFNDNQGDDFTTLNQMVVASAIEFSESWKLEDYCNATHNTDDTCSFAPHRRAWATRQCSALRSEVFAPCHAEVDYEMYFSRCVFDTCACDMGGDCECLCTAIAAYAHECNANGVPIRWRSQDLCHYHPACQVG
ncbi:von Willebrand factor [Saccoglossus kowalevskii]